MLCGNVSLSGFGYHCHHTQMVLKVHNVDGSTKMIAIHEQMNARDVCILLAERNHKQIGPNWTLVERLTDLHLGELCVCVCVCVYVYACVHVCVCGCVHVSGEGDISVKGV